MVATSPEEIASQHSQAEQIVQSNQLPCAPKVDRGEIPLCWKRHPTTADPFYSKVEAGKNGLKGRNVKGGLSKMDDPSMDGIDREAAGASADASDGGSSSSCVVEGKDVGSVGFAAQDEEKTEEELQQRSGGSTDREHEEGCCVSSRGVVDVRALAELCREGHNDPAPPPSKSSLKAGAGKKKQAGQKTNGAKEKKGRSTTQGTASSPASDAAKAEIKSLTNLWDEANATTNNVAVTRPSHDNWGIKKIVLIFCDDFLQDVYEMPWLHSDTETATAMRSAIQPILDVLNVPRSRVVRMLLAALPPGVTIPVHHDSGEWVRHTHRVHVPIIVADPNKILFRCGPTEQTMDRISCDPGHVFEMNNQAKHAVSNCHPTDHRVHLILDYVDETFHIHNRIRLNAGEKLLQTRRSIDREINYGKRPTPSYMILGAQKAGTTSLYDYLNQHPLIVRARRRETHCLDWRWDETLTTTAKRRAHCHKFFFTEELKPHPSLLTGDSTPSYLLDSVRAIPRLKEVFPHRMKFFVMIRDPVKRARSQYAMVTALDGTPEQIKHRGTEWLSMSFADVVRQDIRNMKEDGLIPYWDEVSHTVDRTLFDTFVGSKEEDEAWTRYLTKHIPLNRGSHSLVSRGMYELNLRDWFRAFPREDFLVLKLEDMANSSSSGDEEGNGVQRTVSKALRHLDLPQYEVVDETPKNTRSYDYMEEDVRVMLERFYEPHNGRLECLLGEEWRDPWTY